MSFDQHQHQQQVHDPRYAREELQHAFVGDHPAPFGYDNRGQSGSYYDDEDDDDDEDADADTLGTNETDLGHTRLFVIIEEGMPRPSENRQISSADIVHRNEIIQQTYAKIRRFFANHSDPEELAAAAMVRGNNDATPLHNVCKLSNPPADIVQRLVDAAPETASWPDSHGWLPLHHACANGASGDVLLILAEAYPEGKTKQDSQSRTPLHFYLTQRADNPAAMAANMQFLSDSGAAQLPDVGGMLAMHYACAYGVSPNVLKVLLDAYPDSIGAKENKGRTPMHLAMVNAHRDASPGVIRFLLDHSGEQTSGAQTVNMRDHDGYLPLHLLALGLRGFRGADEPEQRNNVAECLKMYLGAEPHAAADFLTALQDLPDWLQDVAVVSPHVRAILNKKIAQRFPTSILMLDGYMLIVLIVCFAKTTTAHINSRFGDPSDKDTTTYLVFLFLGGTYFLLREFVQIISLWSLGSISSWFYDPTNWLDMSVIILVFYYGVLMTDDNLGVSKEAFRSGVAVTQGVIWCAVISFLKSTLVDFAVFVGGVFYVVQRLAAFLWAVSVILLAFAQMFYIVYTETPICDLSEANYLNPNFPASGPCQFPHCTFPRSLLKVYTMMMGEINDETRYESYLVAQILYVMYAFLVVILLSNVLIAIVTDSYEIIQNDRAAIVFWSNRLDFVAEMDAISYGFRDRLKLIKDGGGGVPGAPTHVQEGPSGYITTEHNKNSNQAFHDTWKNLVQLFDQHLYDDVDMSPSNLEFWCYFLFRGLAVVFVIPFWVILGLITAGCLWPPQVREFLFVQKETAISRADREKNKLEQLKEIQTNIKNLKTELKKEMASDRDAMLELKREVEVVQEEVMSDLQQVRELLTTLVDMGRTRGRR